MTKEQSPGQVCKKAVVVGALGVSGRAIVHHLTEQNDWEVVGLSRRLPDFSTEARFLACDVLNHENVKRHAEEFRDITHNVG